MVNAERIVVLNVDDYEAGRYATSRILRQAGFEVVEADTGEAALRLAAEVPDLIVLDVNLPDLDGFEVCRRIKAESATEDIPVLYLSAAYRGPEHRVQGLELGADGYLTQPVDPRELVATVNALLRTRHVRDAVERSEQRFRSLMTATSDIIWTAAADGRFAGEQGDWVGFTGQTPAEHGGWGWLEAIHPDDRSRTREAWARALETSAEYVNEQRLRHRSGEYRDMLVRAVPLTEPDGSVREWVGAHTDITDRKRAERVLRDRNERLEFLSEAANRLLMTDDAREYADQLFERVSRYLGLELYLNYLPDDGALVLRSHRGVPPERLAGMERLEMGEAVCGAAALQRESTVVEDVQASGADEVRTIRALGLHAYACFPLVAGGHLIGIVAFGTRSRARFTADELSLMQTVSNQAAAAMERERLILELRERARALEEANRVKRDFLATMSHELRTPLNAMVGYTDLLLLGVPEPIPEAAHGHVNRIRGAAVHLSQLIEEVLTHARIEAGHDELNREEVDLPELIATVSGLMEPLARQKGLDFVVETEGAPERVDTDPRKLRQILLNLLGNAVKFTEQGRISLTVRGDADTLTLRVADTGIGIDSSHLAKIFEPFWQVDGSRTRVAGGTGLGLGVVRQLAVRLGGDVEVRSDPGGGSEFTVTLPLGQGATRPGA